MLFALKDIEAQFYDRLRVYMWIGISLLCIGSLIWASLRIRSWFFDSDESEVPAEEMITQFRQLKRQGELSEEEFRLISQRLSGSKQAPVASANDPKHPPDSATPQAEKSTDVEED
jgi:hypothetical protein